MDALLIDGWLAGRETIRVLDEASLSEVRECVQALGNAHAMPTQTIERAKLVATELGGNQLVHALRGEMAVTVIERDGITGLELIAADGGPGIGDVTAALSRHNSIDLERPSLGIGLGASRRLSDEMDFDIRMMEGSCVTARIFAQPVRRRPELAIVGRPHPREQFSGDGAALVRFDTSLVIGVIDGVGHGLEARASAKVAARLLREHAGDGIVRVLERCHSALRGQRGAVMSVVRIDERAGVAEHVGVGNIAARVYSRDRARGFVSRPMTLGAAGRRLSLMPETQAFASGDVLLMFSDDLSSKTSLTDTPALSNAPPIVIAEHLIEQHARGRDDALIAVVR